MFQALEVVIEDRVLDRLTNQMKIMILIVVEINLAVVVLNLEIQVIEMAQKVIDLDQVCKKVIVRHQDHRMTGDQAQIIETGTKVGIDQDLETMVILKLTNIMKPFLIKLFCLIRLE